MWPGGRLSTFVFIFSWCHFARNWYWERFKESFEVRKHLPCFRRLSSSPSFEIGMYSNHSHFTLSTHWLMSSSCDISFNFLPQRCMYARWWYGLCPLKREIYFLFYFIFKYLMSKTWEVFTQSSEPEAHVKNAWQTKKYKTGYKVDYVYTNIKKNLKTS